nr:hypothetical protein [Clostridia bacterium]
MSAKLNRINEEELNTRIQLNYTRLSTGDYYSIDNIFSPESYDWYGDKEGRALLAFLCHCKISGNVIPCMNQMLEQLDGHLNSEGYFGPTDTENVHEQQLSGHSWFLRGLCEHYEIFGDDYSLNAVRRIAENLFLPIKGRFASYPVQRSKTGQGGVSGSKTQVIDGWIL